MVAAHMDEVGIIIKKICGDGTLKFGFVGGVDQRVAIGKRVIIGERQTVGVIGIKAVHLTSADERRRVPKPEELYIDIGAADEQSAAQTVSPGDYGTFCSEYRILSDDMIKGRALDDRIGCAVMLDLLGEPLKYDTWFAFTVQEEVGLRGAAPAAYGIKPDVALILETTTAADIPETAEHKKVCKVGCGAVISFMDRMTVYDRELFLDLCAEAQRQNIKYQTKTMVAGGNDAGIIHKTASGAKCINISVPVRYLHSPSSIAAISDCAGAERLAKIFLESRM